MKDRSALVSAVSRFHGHMCPGLAIGIRVGEIALREIGPHAADEEVVAVVETDMCAVDAVQYMTGCTFGKGNLVHLDYGKNAFRFWRRADGKGIRIAMRPGGFQRDPEHQALFAKVRAKTATPEERERFHALHEQAAWRVLDVPEEQLFSVTESVEPVPAPARIHESVVCEDCGEAAMETRARRFGGRNLCIPCFERRDRRWK